MLVRKYNFNPARDEVLPGSWKWELINDAAAPEFYSRLPRRRRHLTRLLREYSNAQENTITPIKEEDEEDVNSETEEKNGTSGAKESDSKQKAEVGIIFLSTCLIISTCTLFQHLFYCSLLVTFCHDGISPHIMPHNV